MQTDLLIVGGGINGAGIARDAAGRGLGVVLCEKDDLGGATSSASSKLVHGGLRYLEHCQFRLVRESLAEREVLLLSAPHLVHPVRFVMPHVPELRPAWMIRAGLTLYDHLARRQTLPRSTGVDLRTSPYGAALRPQFARGFAYSDCRVDDARLVVANAAAAAGRGAVILPRTACVAARREGAAWRATLEGADGARIEVRAGALINAAGPWVGAFFAEVVGKPAPFRLKLVKGSHIVVPRLYAGEHAYILQNDDRRVVFVSPFERHYTLIGTTDIELREGPGPCAASAAEVDYLCRAVNRYFAKAVSPGEVAWSYCGVRSLCDDSATDPSKVTRDYTLHVDGDRGSAPLMSVLGGKITTYRSLAEHALAKLAPGFPRMTGAWTAGASLPGGNLGGVPLARFAGESLRREFPWLSEDLRIALACRHGANTRIVLGGATGPADLGRHFGAELYQREIDHFIAREWAASADDVLWRRTKAGLHLSAAQRQAVARYVAQRTNRPL